MNSVRSRGFALVDIAVALVVLAMITAVAIPLISARQKDVREQAAALQIKQIGDAASQYIKDNFDTLFSAASTGVVPVPMSALLGAGKLPSSFVNKNPYAQSYCLLIRRSPAAVGAVKLLESLVVTEGGAAIAPTRVPFVAAMVGASGGAFESVGGTLMIRGAYGGYQFNASTYSAATCSGTAPSEGHLASALFFDNRNLIADYLYRFEVPGHPEANQMFTDITLNNHDILDGGNIKANSFVDKNNPLYQVTPSGSSYLDTLQVNNMFAGVYYDLNDSSYYLDPNGTSRLADSYITNRSSTVRLSSYLPNFVDKGSAVLFANQLLIKPSCPDSGAPEIRLAPAVFQPDTSLLSNVYAIDAGGAWQVKLTSSGGTTMPPGTSVVASYGCRYL